MLPDIEDVAQNYIGCPDCWYGYDNYDQKVFHDFSEHIPFRISEGVKVLPRFSKCNIIEYKYTADEKAYQKLPLGTINCVTLVGADVSNSKINIEFNGYTIYVIKDSRTMVFIPNNGNQNVGMHVNNFDGLVKLHYVNYEATPGRYRIYQKVSHPVWPKYKLYSHNKFNHSGVDLQTMWNYVFPGKRPKNKFLIHGRPAVTEYYRCFDRDGFDGARYNEIIVIEEGYFIQRYTA